MLLLVLVLLVVVLLMVLLLLMVLVLLLVLLLLVLVLLVLVVVLLVLLVQVLLLMLLLLVLLLVLLPVLLEASRGPWRASWGHLGEHRSKEEGPSISPPPPSGAQKIASWSPLGALFEGLGVLLGLFGGVLGPSWGPLGRLSIKGVGVPI